MAYIQIVYTNNDSQDGVDLPPRLGGYSIAAGGTLTKVYNSDNWPNIARGVRPEAYGELERLLERFIFRDGVDTGVDAAGAQIYNITLPAALKPGSVIIQIPQDGGGFINMVDDGAGALAEEGGNGTGTVNYATGAIAIANDIDGGTIASSGDILADYRFQQLSAVITDAGITANGINTNDILDALV